MELHKDNKFLPRLNVNINNFREENQQLTRRSYDALGSIIRKYQQASGRRMSEVVADFIHDNGFFSEDGEIQAMGSGDGTKLSGREIFNVCNYISPDQDTAEGLTYLCKAVGVTEEDPSLLPKFLPGVTSVYDAVVPIIATTERLLDFQPNSLLKAYGLERSYQYPPEIEG